MAKAKKRPQKKIPSTPASYKEAKVKLSEALNKPLAAVVFFAALFIFLLWFYKPIVIDGLDVQGSDVISGIGKTKQIKNFQEISGERPLWNSYMFAGMPIYHRNSAVTWSVDTLISQLDVVVDWRAWYLWLGALGIFLLLKFLKLHNITAMMAALGYILLPHFHALIVVGHFSKLRALMWMPFVLLTFLFFLERRSIFSAVFFTAAFALQLRTQHYQIIFYTILLLFFVGIVPYIKMMLEKKWSDFLKLNAYFFISMALVVLIVAQPLLVTRDYTPYSTRGGNAVSVDEQVSEKDKKGVGFDYATNWSYSVAEFWNLIIPKFHGGTSQERYTGDAVPQLKNRVIPAYWGELPFTQSYEYLSIILAFLALLGILYHWKNPLVKSLTFLSILALLLSLGKNFDPLYKLFFYYLPYFDKFRVPMMILTLVSFNACVLAAFGLNYLLQEGFKNKQSRQNFYILSGVFLLLLVIPLIFGSGFSLAQPGEGQRYSAQVMELLRQARLDILKVSAWRTLIFFGFSAILVFLLGRRITDRGLIALGLVFLVAIDLGTISHSYLKDKFVNLDQLEQQTYQETAVDRIIKQDDSLYRVLPPIRNVANDSRWAYHYQSIGGYSAAKLQEIQDLISNNLIDASNPQMPLNLEVVSMLNGKYIVSNQPYQHRDLLFLGGDQSQNLYLFRNQAVLPRAFFVDSVRVFEDGTERLQFMNTAEFKPRTTALLEEPLSEEIEAPDSAAARVTHFEPDKLTLEVFTDKQALLVLSEVYYPRGWKAFLENGQELQIHKTNHILRSMVVPQGNHTITLEFRPATYYSGIRLSWIGWIITYLGLMVFAYRQYGRKIRDWLQRKKAGNK
jgi:hypothetical protein